MHGLGFSPNLPEPDSPESRPRLLMIDDDRKRCRLVVAYLQPLGFDVTAIHTDPDGVERAPIAEEPWHAVILDVMLPGIDGIEVLKKIRARFAVPVIMLTPVEFDLLASLAKAKGRVKSREPLIDECRDRNNDVFDRSIDVHISSLRKKLGDDAKEPRYIRTVRSPG